MARHVFAVTVAVLVLSGAVAHAQPDSIYHWRSFIERASVLHIGESNDGYEIVAEKWGPLLATEGWPVEVYVTFNFWAGGEPGVQGYCWMPEEAFRLDERSGAVRLDGTVSFDGCDWLQGAASLRLQVAWTPDGSYHSRRHYTLLGDMNRTSSEQGWEDRWGAAEVDGAYWIDGAAAPTAIPADQTGYTYRGWGHGIIPILINSFD